MKNSNPEAPCCGRCMNFQRANYDSGRLGPPLCLRNAAPRPEQPAFTAGKEAWDNFSSADVAWCAANEVSPFQMPCEYYEEVEA